MYRTIVPIGVLAFIGLFFYCVLVLPWLDVIDRTAPRITFEAFKKLYALSPSNWDFCNDRVKYHSDSGYIRIEFKHYIDVIRYGFFKNKVEKNNDYLEKMQNEKKFLASVQNDIDSYRRENLAELERIINDTQSNAENLLQKAEVNSGGDDY